MTNEPNETEMKALKLTLHQGGRIIISDMLGNAYEITSKLANEGYLRKLKTPDNGIDPTHSHFYKLTNKGKKAIKEYEMTPMSKEILDKRRRTIEYNKKLNERVRV